MFGLGIGTKNKKGEWLEIYYPYIRLEVTDKVQSKLESMVSQETLFVELDAAKISALAEIFSAAANEAELTGLLNKLKNSARSCILFCSATDSALVSIPQAYFKLHCLSMRLKKPNEQNLDGIFPFLPNVVWTNQGAVDLNELPELLLKCRLENRYVSVDSVDKFPKMTDYVVPAGVRIADSARVRLGAYVGKGTTVMHEGFINFNAGTAGTSMVEGRISAKVFVGEGSDLGGGCSTMGTLSGGGNQVISVGEKCLIGANAGLGISLGDRCTIESGLYITSGSKVKILDENKKEAGIVKALELSEKSDLLFRRNSTNGCIECLTNKTAIALNHELHLHN